MGMPFGREKRGKGAVPIRLTWASNQQVSTPQQSQHRHAMHAYAWMCLPGTMIGAREA